MSANVRIKVLPLSFRRRQKLRKYGPLVVWLTAEVGVGVMIKQQKVVHYFFINFQLDH